MSVINVELIRDEAGYPSSVTITRKGRKVTALFDKDRGFQIKGRMYPAAKDLLKLIYPATLESKFLIPEPLEVVSIPGGGTTILFDDMEELLKWRQDSGTVSLDNTVACNGSQSLQIACGALDASARADRFFSMPPSGKIKISFNWNTDNYTDLEALQVDVLNERVANSNFARFRYYTSPQWDVWDGAAWLRVFDPLAVYTDANIAGPWIHTVLKVDFGVGLYKFLQVNDLKKKFGTSSSLPTYAGAAYSSYVAIYVDNVAGQAVNGWIDDFLVTEWIE